MNHLLILWWHLRRKNRRIMVKFHFRQIIVILDFYFISREVYIEDNHPRKAVQVFSSGVKCKLHPTRKRS